MKKWVDISFARDAALLTVSSGLAGFLFLLVHVVAGRWMEPAAYAGFVSLLGLLWIVMVPSSTLQVAMARYAAEYCHANAQDLWARLFRSVIRLVTIGGAVGLALWAAGSPILRGLLSAASTPALLWLGVIAFLSLYAPVVNGALQGARRFGWLAAAGLAPGLVRLGLAVPVCMAGGGVAAMLGVFAASVAAGLVVGAIPVRRALGSQPSLPLDLRPFNAYFWPVAIGQALLYIFMNADQILMSRLLDGAVLGCYGKASILGRIDLFLAMPIVMAMFPRAVVSNDLKTLLAPVGLALVLTVAWATAVSLAPDLALRLMYGVEGPVYARLLRAYAWAVVPLAMTMMLSQYVWARHAAMSLLWLAPLAAGYIAALWHFGPGDAEAMIVLMAAANSAALVVLLAITHRLVRRRAAP